MYPCVIISSRQTETRVNHDPAFHPLSSYLASPSSSHPVPRPHVPDEVVVALDPAADVAGRYVGRDPHRCGVAGVVHAHVAVHVLLGRVPGAADGAGEGLRVSAGVAAEGGGGGEGRCAGGVRAAVGACLGRTARRRLRRRRRRDGGGG